MLLPHSGLNGGHEQGLEGVLLATMGLSRRRRRRRNSIHSKGLAMGYILCRYCTVACGQLIHQYCTRQAASIRRSCGWACRDVIAGAVDSPLGRAIPFIGNVGLRGMLSDSRRWIADARRSLYPEGAKAGGGNQRGLPKWSSAPRGGDTDRRLNHPRTRWRASGKACRMSKMR